MNNTLTVLGAIAIAAVILAASGAPWNPRATANPTGPTGGTEHGRSSSGDQLGGGYGLIRAEQEWRASYIAAHRSGQWTALITVGDAAAKIDRAAGRPTIFLSEARRAYLDALLRARAEGSVEGIMRAAEAFERLGDREVAAQARRMLPGANPA